MPFRSARRRSRIDADRELAELRARLLRSMAAGGRLPVARLTQPLPVVRADEALEEIEALRPAA